MAGGFDGMEVRTPVTRRAPHKALASVMEVRHKLTSNVVDNLNKYLINKEIMMDLLNFH